MSRAEHDHPDASPRNKPARAALVIAPIFLVQPASVFFYYVAINMGYKPLDVTNPTHPLSGLVSLVAVSSVLCVRVDFFLGLPALIFGCCRPPGRPEPDRAGGPS